MIQASLLSLCCATSSSVYSLSDFAVSAIDLSIGFVKA